MVLLPEIPKEAAMIVAEKIRKNIEDLEITYEDDLIKLTVSIGLGYFSGDSIEMNNMSSMINKVDQRLYKAKNTGRNKVSTEV